MATRRPMKFYFYRQNTPLFPMFHFKIKKNKRAEKENNEREAAVNNICIATKLSITITTGTNDCVAVENKSQMFEF